MTKFQLYGFESFLLTNTMPRLNKKAIKNEGNELATIAANIGVPSLSMNQYKNPNRLFIMLKKDLLIKGQWKNYKVKSNVYNFYANPKIIDKNIQENEDWEQCPSYPGISFRMKRAVSIRVSYYNSELQQLRQEMNGFQSKVFQHQISHNEGQDLLRKCQDIRVDQNVKKQDEKVIMEKWHRYKNADFKESKEQLFRQMKRDYVYRIVDQFR